MNREDLERDTTIEFFRASGPGGQHRNKRETGVRLTYTPLNIVIEATEERSQAQNREIAFKRLGEKLEELSRPIKSRIPTRVSRAKKEQRLKEKHQVTEKKKLRKPPEVNL
ncbi:MAG: peptide chain release factor-like protein [bacterium]|nr:peptide chain release factor-like protein [bacterium]